MPSPVHLVYLWRFDGNRAYIFYGPEGMAESVWAKRHKVESQLNDALRTLTAPPVDEVVVDLPLHAYQARALVRLEQERLKADGVAILNARRRDSYKAGDIKPRPVYLLGPYGHRCWFPSTAAAARALGKSEGAIRKMIEVGNEAYYDPCTK